MTNLLNNRYKLGQELGRGGMGIVYKGIDIQTRKPVAIKTVLTINADQKRFRREYRFLSVVKHDNLIEAYDYIESDEKMFIVFEFVEGMSLGEIVREHKREFSLCEQVAVAANICRGIEVLNAGGIIHRDIKPDNIMVNRNKGIVKILDLGIGKDLANESIQLTQKNYTVGTYIQMSPEQCEGKVNEKSDVFSLGITLYQFFLWRDISPFHGSNAFLTLCNIAKEDPPTIYEEAYKENMISSEWESTYKIVSDAVFDAMQKNASERPSAAYLADFFSKVYDSCVAKTTTSTLNISQGISKTLHETLDDLSQECKDDDVEVVEVEKRAEKKVAKKKEKFRKNIENKRFSGIHHIVYSFLILFLVFSYYYEKNKADEYRKIYKKKLIYAKNKIEKLRKKTGNNNKYYNRGLIKHIQENVRGAFEDYNKAIKLNPNFSKAYWGRAWIKCRQNDFIGATQDYNKAIKLNPDFSKAYWGRAWVKYKQNDFMAAMLDFNMSVKLNPYFANAYYGRGTLKYHRNLKGALEDFDKAIELDPYDADVYISRGWLKHKQNNFVEADYNKAIKLNPNQASAFYNRGIVKHKQNKLMGNCRLHSSDKINAQLCKCL